MSPEASGFHLSSSASRSAAPSRLVTTWCQRMVGRGFRSDFSAVDKALNVAVVSAHLPQRTGPQQVAAAVAGPQAAAATLDNQQNDDSAADHCPRPDVGSFFPQLLVDPAGDGF